MNLPEEPARDEVLEFLSKSSLYGNLGLFIGAGFTKAIINRGMALSWGELVEKVADELGVDYSSLDKEGKSYPEIASSICETLANTSDTYEEACFRLKHVISDQTNWYPTKEQSDEYGNYLLEINPSWIITTNYDLVIESLLPGMSKALTPEDQLIARRGIIPIYHLHGIRTVPESIIITQEDYVSLFRPTEYRQLKLALTIKESTTLILGYGLGDVNVLTAVDWSRNVFKREKEHYRHDIIQVVRVSEPVDAAYRDRNGIVIIEVKEIKDFFLNWFQN